MNRVTRRRAVLFAATLSTLHALPSARAGHTVSTWLGPTTGNWNTPALWSAGVPFNNGSNTFDAMIGAASGSPYAVTLSNDIALTSFTLSAPAALAIGEPPVTVRTTDAAFLLNGSFRLKISGPSTGTFQLLASPDLLTWELVSTLTFVNGLYEFDDTTASQRDGRFYRIVPAP